MRAWRHHGGLDLLIELEARAEMLAAEAEAEADADARNTIYEAFWDLVIEGADNLAYRLALNTLVAGQRLLAFEPRLIAAELADPPAVRELAAAIAAADEDGAHARARELLERSVA